MKKSKHSEPIGKYFRSLRTRTEYTQADISKKLKYSSSQFVSNWERGMSLPPDSVLPALSKLYSEPVTNMVQAIVDHRIGKIREEYSRFLKDQNR